MVKILDWFKPKGIDTGESMPKDKDGYYIDGNEIKDNNKRVVGHVGNISGGTNNWFYFPNNQTIQIFVT